jgi:hypothetical protein
VIQVNRKAAATVVTGATALAGWLTSPSPSQTPLRAPTAAAQVRAPAAHDASESHAATIEEQSKRLAARLRPTGSFARPERDPFHFGVRNLVPPRASVPDRVRAGATAVAGPATVEASAFPYRLSGVASDVVDGLPVRTAVLSGGTSGLVLAVAGDVVGDVYRVDRVDEGAVELTDSRDGRVVRLTFATTSPPPVTTP